VIECTFVMAGFVPAIRVSVATLQDVDARHKAGHKDSKKRSGESAASTVGCATFTLT
jgi:hypothetical protein